jgi:hypothetical protein
MAGVWLVLGLLSAAPAVAALAPERDIVTVVAAQPVAGVDSAPGLLTGERVMDVLSESLEMVRDGVPEAARAGLEALARDLRALAAGQAPKAGIPPADWSTGHPWVPVRVEDLRVQLDAPDLLPDPQAGGEGGRVGDLPARARRTVWLPVAGTAQRVGQALALLGAGQSERSPAQRLLEAALQQVQTRVVLADRPLIIAYYQVEAALGALGHWDEAVRASLRQAAALLQDEAHRGDLADRLQAESDRMAPDAGNLQYLAERLREQIMQDAGPQPAAAT